MISRIFLTVVGILYAGLAIYCAVAPQKAADTVGLEMKGGSGRSEFLTVYGGLEMGMAVFFLWGAWRPEHARSAVLACLAIHACLVLFRGASFAMFAGIAPPTYKLAVGEWVIFLASIGVWWKGK
ncbi:DUF4345 family protein [Lacipirellula limnantheis]|uniref:DUF4345 domain-containing protein n=1 Tax=Lacipirellula limnantheis TaxID=2528024 RepID=A0A517TRU8_9BACT|nr:DUF4345 family protein [Lacipirellula limnantheis]QDT71101.1 hypothetical protein I41_02560 [Lacipirellula limnantheis]